MTSIKAYTHIISRYLVNSNWEAKIKDDLRVVKKIEGCTDILRGIDDSCYLIVRAKEKKFCTKFQKNYYN